MESADYLCRVDAKELSLVPNLVLPPKFKTPEFEKYNGTSCPKGHITMFCRRMTGYVNNDQLLIHNFQDSLAGSTAKWYNQLSRAKIISWKDLAQAIMKQYNHLTDMSTELRCKTWKQKPSESFKQYTQRWKEVATFDDPSGPNVVGNSLPRHLDQGVNTITESGGKRTKTDVAEEVLKGRSYSEFHTEEGHEIQKCTQFRALVQSLVDNKELKLFEDVKGSEEGDIYALEEGSTEKVHKNSVGTSEEGQDINFYTRSRRHYNPVSARIEPIKGKTLAVEHKKEKTVRLESPVNEPINENKAKGFLKFLKHSKYSVVEQLHKQPTHIAVLALLLSLEIHRSALMKVLNETYVANDISMNKLHRLVNNISADNFIFFNDDEIPSGGMGSTKALHITTHSK
ncbi:Gag-pro-like protein [Gossypium australe]|uniref:Gag-pro-like protein n=1 Tax=Gossypium australe TaxID=47621 RepID=A0A5B6WJN8_9ROSI|nr:Gag-pro-like protein [Gossypium australe]